MKYLCRVRIIYNKVGAVTMVIETRTGTNILKACRGSPSLNDSSSSATSGYLAFTTLCKVYYRVRAMKYTSFHLQ
jgi:hypothetical protein